MAKSTSKSRSKPKSRAKTAPRKPVTHNQTHILLKKGLLIYSLLLFIAFFLVSLSIFAVTQVVETRDRQERSDRIWGIYQSLNLDDSYRGVTADILDTKHVYSWDYSRSKSSEMTFGRMADRPETFDDIKQRIEAAGFQAIEGPEYGEAARQDHYKNSDGVYIRVGVDTKNTRDAMVYGTEMAAHDSAERLETGPVFVTLKVNLDDNNE